MSLVMKPSVKSLRRLAYRIKSINKVTACQHQRVRRTTVLASDIRGVLVDGEIIERCVDCKSLTGWSL